MNIGILTYYGVHNHGAVLQANALRAILKSKGHDCGFLEFERSYSNISQKQAKKYKIGLRSIPFYTNYLMKKGIRNILYNIEKRKILEDFRAKNIPLIGKYDDFTGDLVVIGSDEVFSLEVGVNPFLYGNDLKAKHVISYAGSFGPTTYVDVIKKGMQEMIFEGIKNMDVVSVRDMNSLEIIKKTTGIDAVLVCDPVILFGYDEERHSYTPPMQNYILIYSYDKNMNDPAEYNYIKEYAKKHSLAIVSVGYYHRWCKCINPSPMECLGWIENASLVVTDTFHGSVMSIVSNTPMIVKLRENENKLRFLLFEYGLLGRIIADFSELDKAADTAVDFDFVNAAIQDHRMLSMKFLDDALAKCK